MKAPYFALVLLLFTSSPTHASVVVNQHPKDITELDNVLDHREYANYITTREIVEELETRLWKRIILSPPPASKDSKSHHVSTDLPPPPPYSFESPYPPHFCEPSKAAQPPVIHPLGSRPPVSYSFNSPSFPASPGPPPHNSSSVFPRPHHAPDVASLGIQPNGYQDAGHSPVGPYTQGNSFPLDNSWQMPGIQNPQGNPPSHPFALDTTWQMPRIQNPRTHPFALDTTWQMPNRVSAASSWPWINYYTAPGPGYSCHSTWSQQG